MNIENTISAFKQAFPHTPTEDQERAAEELCRFIFDNSDSAFFTLKGYAGTGKTTLVSSLVRILPMLDLDFILLAPTGRAAKVLSSYSGKKAFTIHKKIYRLNAGNEGVVSFTLKNNRHKNTVFIVDEASMISTKSGDGEQTLFDANNILDDLVAYVYGGNNCKLLLIGDDAQLPPVHMEKSPALDEKYLRSKYNFKIYSSQLSRVVRQSLESGVLYNATLIRNKLEKPGKSVMKFKLAGFDDVKSFQGWELEDAIVSSFSTNEKGRSVIICRSNKRANLYNREIRNRVLFFEEELSSGDQLMATKNNYFWLPETSDAGFIANGDMMEVMRVKKTEKCYGFRFADLSVKLTDYPDQPVVELKIIIDSLHIDKPSLSFQDLKKLYEEIEKDYSDIPDKRKRYIKTKRNPYYNALQAKFAYAITCHKSQGGQWENVFVEQAPIYPSPPGKEYYRWLYTAVTRATKNLYLIGFSDEFF